MTSSTIDRDVQMLDPASKVERVPLFVDLDGSLVATDTLIESVLLLAKQQPLSLFRLPFWLMKGKAYMKRQIADRVSLNAASLPYRTSLMEYIHQERADGRRIVLATAADASIGRSVADYLGVFDEVLASDGVTNLSSSRKLRAIQESSPGSFDYVGNSHDDVALWAAARQSFVAAPNPGVLRSMKAVCAPERLFDYESTIRTRQLVAGIKALRPHQWVKNVLLAVPLVAAHEIDNLGALMAVGVSFASFCAAASSVYVVNDLLDLEADRLHPTKRKRPFASGALPLIAGIIMAPALLCLALLIGSLISLPFVGMIAAYVVISTTYSVYLKRKLLIDVFVLAGLYTHRILAGGVAIGVVLTPWLLAFSMFLFISLAFAKRFTELRMVRLGSGKTAKGRGYTTDDLEIFTSVGPGSGYMAVLVLCLYINSDAVLKLYRHPELLWLACPAMLYWVTRLWFLAQRGELPDDPVRFALRDKASYAVAAFVAMVVILASVA